MTRQADRNQGLAGWLRQGSVAAWLILLLSQAVFWSLLGLGEYAVRPEGARYAPSLSLQRLDDQGATLDPAPLEVPLHPAPVYRFRDDSGARRAVFTYRFDYVRGESPWGLYLTTSRRVEAVRLNGIAISAPTALDTWSILGGFDPMLFDLPEQQLKAGPNTLEFEVLGVSNKILPAFFVGDFDRLFSAYAWAQLISVDLLVAGIGVMLFVLLLCALTPWNRIDQPRVRALMLLLALWSLRNLSFFGFDAAIPPPWRQVTHYQVTFLFLIAIAWFAARWTGQGAGQGRRYLGGALGSVLVCVAVGLTGDNARVFNWLFPVESILSLLLVGVALLRFVRYAARRGGSARYEAALFMICLTAVLVDAIDDRYDIGLPLLPDWPLTFYAAPVCGLLLALGSCAVLVRQSQRARALLESLNQVMDQRLDQQARALNQAHEREQQLVRERAVLSERQRLMRDMHDGLGGHLVSLLMRLRSAPFEPDAAEKEAARALDDLRLIVVSLDHAEESLGITLGSFRERFEPRLRDAGLELGWDIEPEAGAAHLPAEQMLHVLRMLQEAATNSLKHASARRLNISLRCAGPDTLCLEVEDDGTGIPADALPGKGLANLRHRATRIGATLTIDSHSRGTRLRILLPIDNAGAAASAPT